MKLLRIFRVDSDAVDQLPILSSVFSKEKRKYGTIW